ncbi:MAG TPA: plasmid pRiA4b ORF-3 family protein [Caulobacteraceae bacterium]|jgi:hypothetical protein|nr:plasmid pRiA4b ORF-3 family protein [Caulobacteraceae bacterium]
MSAVPDIIPEQIATLRIELVDTDPLIWRQVEVPTSITLRALHDVIQAAMGWFDQHLWELRLGKQTYGSPMDGDWGDAPRIDAGKIRLSQILKPRKTVIDYTYDFGDSWEHRLTFTDIRHGQPDTAYPRYCAGDQAAPPEDCGGLPGFYAVLEALTDPNHPGHPDVAEWYANYEPGVLDDLPLKVAIGRIASRRRAGKTRKVRPSDE